MRRANRPNTRLLLTKRPAQNRTCKKGAIHTGPSGRLRGFLNGSDVEHSAAMLVVRDRIVRQDPLELGRSGVEIENTETGKFETWTPEEVAAAYERREIALIDVRTPQEYMFEHMEGALLLPMSFVDAERLPSQEGKRLVIYCGSSMRSEKVARQCLAKGVQPVTHMKDGFAGWKKAGLPYIGTDMATGGPRRVQAKKP